MTYIAKLPAEAAALIFEWAGEMSGAKGAALGPPLGEVATGKPRKAPDPFEVDPDVVDRGTRGHQLTQDALRRHLLGHGLEPRGPHPDGPNIDVGWEDGRSVSVAEIKSLTEKNEEKQLRLGLGQVLRYRHGLAGDGRRVRAALVVERRPSDDSWGAVCESLDVVLAWPGCFEGVGAAG